MLTLHHMPGAICAQKVRVCLAEKGLDWDSRLVTGQLRTPEYLKLNPGGYVPTLVDDDRVVLESRIINEYLDDAYPQTPLMPASAFDRAQVSLWTKQIDDSLHLNVFTLSLAAGLLPHFLAMGPAELEANLPFDITKRERAFDIIEKRMDSRYVRVALQRFGKLISDMDEALTGSPWLAGDGYSLADVDFAPYAQRMEDLGLAFLWEDKPHVRRWIAQVRARPSHAEIVDRWVAPEMRARTLESAARASAGFRERFAAA